jgi:hypothetical protein
LNMETADLRGTYVPGKSDARSSGGKGAPMRRIMPYPVRCDFVYPSGRPCARDAGHRGSCATAWPASVAATCTRCGGPVAPRAWTVPTVDGVRHEVCVAMAPAEVA